MDKNNVRFVLSFVDKSVRVKTVDKRTIASIQSGFKFTKFDRYFEQFGFTQLPSFVVDVLDYFGYTKDYGLGMWVTKTSGVAQCSPEDDFDETKGRRIAVSRAKEDAYVRSFDVLDAISNTFRNISEFAGYSANIVIDFAVSENEAINNVIEYGVSRPNKD